ncbi:hypothetical protein RchiOBHm_Chr6g0246661 [Rosa chinensis]|uniref:Uncharacterized protein n=1 Tax=Rosa chinensis TaxID=74649 RepID=A0A2P6PJK9_ROSCH|nr:hypothetical protein RchiOBHm_Chr6g0246661 [Rosa chinensis]
MDWDLKVAYIEEVGKTRFFKLLEAVVWEFKDFANQLQHLPQLQLKQSPFEQPEHLLF